MYIYALIYIYELISPIYINYIKYIYLKYISEIYELYIYI